MKLLAFLLAFVTPQGPQDPPPADPNVLQYQSLLLGLKFNYPKTWELTTNKKGESRLFIPVENSSDRAVVEILPVNFRSEPEIWQLSQVGYNKTLKRAIERQWEEEILNVPLLLTKVTYNDKGTERITQTGLIYTLGFNKMLYRITASPAEFEKADYAWRQVLLSLRTWDGSMPKAEDQSKIEIKNPNTISGKPGDDVPHPQIPHEINKKSTVKLVKSPVAANFEVGGQKLTLNAPTDWKVEAKDGGFVLRSPGVAGEVKLSVFSATASDPAAMALVKTSAATLNEFTKVTIREEFLPRPNKAGAVVAAIWRMGSTATGSLFTGEASSQTGDYYFLLTYRSDTGARWLAERRLIESLLDRTSIEPAP